MTREEAERLMGMWIGIAERQKATGGRRVSGRALDAFRVDE